ncbi:MAG: hypothetical protein KAR76_06200 [Methanosarcinales archaeon]|nr:hypothetical protein [Methanosarcinales archaeon]
MKKLGFFKRRKFRQILNKSKSGLTILLRPDPTVDSLASAYALTKIAEYFHVSARCYYIGTAHHKGLLNIVGQNIEPLPDVITDELFMTVALVDVIPSDLPEDLSISIGTPDLIISHSKVATKDIKSNYKDIRANIETTSTLMIQYMRRHKVPIDSTTATVLLFAIRESTKNFLINVNLNGLEAYHFILGYIDNDLLLKLEKPDVKPETFSDLANAINNKHIKGAYLLTNTGYVKDPSTLSKVVKYMLDLEGISTALVFAVNTSNIYVYANSDNIEINMKQIFRKAFGHCGNILGGSSYASISIPLGVFCAITKGDNCKESKQLMLETISNSIYNRFLNTIEEGESKLGNE